MSRLNKNLQSKKKAYVHVHPVPKKGNEIKLKKEDTRLRGFYQFHTFHPSLLFSCASSAAS